MLRLYKITMDHVGHGHCPHKQIAAPDVETAIEAMKQSLDRYDVGKDGKPVGVIAVDTITHIDIIANAPAHRTPGAETTEKGQTP